jgi:hypothetical protein
LPLDFVEIRYKARVYNNGKLVHREPQAIMKYQAGLSGKSVHVQVLGARNLLCADFGGSSDPYVAAVYSGRRIGFTRVRPKALNPKWDNDYPLIKIYHKESDKWDNKKTEKYKNEENLRKCPLSRK